MRVLVCFGTRPEAIKMAPVCKALTEARLEYKICVTAQHREMLDQVLGFFEIRPDYDLNLMSASQSLNSLSANILQRIDEVLDAYNPDIILVQGDTTTAMSIALAGYHRQIKIGHVEAGLRTYNKFSPYPEEINRQLISRLADFHFAPTEKAYNNLIREGIDRDSVIKTGNTVVDALNIGLKRIKSGMEDYGIKDIEQRLDTDKKLVLVTGHRRENFGSGLKNICLALLDLAKNGIQIIFPVHLNPKVKEPVKELLGKNPGILLTEPLNYPQFIWLMDRADLIISDSGGVQEEAPSFEKHVLVTREFTEREESLEAGFSFLVGTDKDLIIKKTYELLGSNYTNSNKSNPYGDGKAAKRIVDFIKKQEN